MANTRLHKWMATQGVTSRRMAEKWILAGRVEVNGAVETTLGRQIDPTKDRVRVDGKLLNEAPPHLVYWMMNKPDATITSRNDPERRATVYDLPSLAKQPFPVLTVGRLDYRTEGLLLLSNDGDLVNRLMHPKYHVPRVYDVLIPFRLRESQMERFAKGIRLDDGPVGPIDIRACGSKNLGATRGSWYRLTVHEGRNRLVRRLFEKLGVRIIRLVRVAYGPIRLPEQLSPGEVVPLAPEQIAALKRATELAPPLPNAVARKSARTKRPVRASTSASQSPRTTEATPPSVP
jgi:23S rRNA pseudouridine2605 synthase